MQQQITLFRTTKGFQQNHKTTELKCTHCKQDFLANRKTAKFCSSSCRSQFWMAKNNKKVITISVPADIDDAYLEKIKNMLINYKPSVDAEESTPIKTKQEESFNSEKELRDFMKQAGFSDYKIPKHDMGIYYDEGLSIKKLDDSWEVRIVA
ncbi:hypothetical protein OAD66_02975 [Bacteroidia bacterium]|nr:hypothetical protein [Bacteroidia bacterium]MDB9882075.1 hypothetical protein [Bacteroidia bacterium]